MKSIYLDYGATSPIREEALQKMLPFFQKEFANPGSIHDIGARSFDAIQIARNQVAYTLGADSCREIIFTSSGTESNNLAIMGVARQRKKQGNHIITTAIEHPSVLEVCHHLEKEGFCITYVSVDKYGQVHIEDIRKALNENTILVSVMAANNEVGTIQPLQEISQLLKGKPILLHSDAIQYLGKIPFTVDQLGVDLLSIASHKIYGPKGVGALYIKKGVRLQPILYGGGQERTLRPSTLNTPAIVGFGEAAYLAAQESESEQRRLAHLRDQCWNLIQQEIDEVELNGHPTNRLPNNLNLSFHRVDGQAILLELNRSQIYISSGSACSAGKFRPSHVLMSMGKNEDSAFQSIRITLGKNTTIAEINLFVKKLKEVIDYLRSLLHD